MVQLASFSKGMRVAVFGASGGLGRAFVDELTASAQVETLYAFARSGNGRPFDATDEASIKAAFDTIEGALDLVICAIGVLHEATSGLAPEKSYRQLSHEGFEANFAANTIGPALIAKYALPRLRRDAKACLAILSARVGSISDNEVGGWYAYRASKAALNQVVKCLAIEHGRRRSETIVLALQPGTVDTTLSKPFQGGVAAEKLFDANDAAQKLLNTIDAAGPENSGTLMDWKGDTIPF